MVSKNVGALDATDFALLKSERIRALAVSYATEAAPPGSLAHMLACTAMWFANRSFENQLSAALRPFGLSPQAMEILIVLRVQPGKQLAFPALRTLLGLHPASLTYISDRLADEGHIERLAHESDRRIVVAKLTAQGETVIKRALKELSRVDYGFPTLSNDDALRLAELLGKMGPQ